MNEKAYIQKCQDLQVEGSGDWEGKIKAMFTMLEKNRRESNDQFNRLNMKIDRILSR